ncbi:UNVERIFIED_CONTAM: hypothetical protein Sradi_2040300 [Sesamum radiatum]|uniref:Uncharacterized protein n=1 Tax=Sesamum radiatum TaxID=300843 RepID=A0AAW2THI3_SESRA
MYAQKSSIKIFALAASFSVSTSQDFSHPDRDGSSCSLSFANNTHRSQTTTQVDGQMENEPLPFPLSDDCHMSFGMPLDLHAPEHRINHDKYEKQLGLAFGSKDISNSTPKLLGFGRLAKIGESPWCLPEAPTCMHCGAIRFHREPPDFCCSNGQVSLSTLDVPEELRDLFFGSSQMSLHFKANSRTYNNVFAFTSFGSLMIRSFAVMTKMYTHLESKDWFITSLMTSFPRRERELICNYIFMMLRMRIVLRADPGLDQRIYNVPAVDQVAAIWKDSDECDESQSRDIRVYPKSRSQKIEYYYGCYDPLQYPLLFPRGEPGWHVGIKRKNHSEIIGYQKRMRSCEGEHLVHPSRVSSGVQLLQAEAEGM